jgi:preprotein translocase subunit SecE
MAKNKAGGRSSTAMIDDAGERQEDMAGPAEADRVPTGPSSVVRTKAGPRKAEGLFQVYKPGQGYYTRMGTGVFFGVLILWAAHFTWEQLAVLQISGGSGWRLYARYGVPVGVLAGLGLLLYYVVGVNRRAIDFFIATEGEMKKVSWSSKKEVVGSTKVVIVTTVLLGIFLFFVDIAFQLFFAWIDVLRVAPNFFGSLFGLNR